jgi:hypothetical protein
MYFLHSPFIQFVLFVTRMTGFDDDGVLGDSVEVLMITSVTFLLPWRGKK